MHRFFESIIHPALTILQPRVIVEIGIDEGFHTQKLLQYCQTSGATLHSIDPNPHCDIQKLQTAHEGRFIFHTDLSLNVLPHIETYDVVLIDGDHNWYTVYNELLLIEKKVREQGQFPLIFLHDIGWPYGHRDLYYTPGNIPTAYRQPYEKKGIAPGNSALEDDDGLNAHLFHATHEHGIHNGVLTAIEDFLTESIEKLHFQKIPGLSGLGMIASPALLEDHHFLRTFLENVRITPPVAQHIDALERVYVEHTVRTQQRCWRGDQAVVHFKQIEQELTSVRASRDRLDTELVTKMHEYRRKLHRKDLDIERMTQSRSWRWTVPFRMAECLLCRLSSFGMSTIMRFLRFLRTTLGSPIPSISRYVRPIQPLLQSSCDFRTAAIVICHNRGLLLKKTIENLLTQTQKFTEILIVDDHSTDTTKQIALQYAGHGVEYLHGTWHNEGTARNAGFRSTESPFLVFLRPGEYLPSGYLSCCQAALGEHPDAAIIYPDQTSKEHPEKHTPSPDPFDSARFERENFFPDCSTVRRTALLEVGGWNHGLLENATWITWRRILANGWKAVKIPGVIVYAHKERPQCHPSTTLSMTPSLDATLCLSLSGREWMWPRTKEFLEQQTYPHAHTHLVIIDTSQDIAFGGSIQSWLSHCDYGKHTYLPLSVGLKGLADLPRRVVHHEVAVACSLIYESFSPLCTTVWVFFLEDDVLPPIDVYTRLLRHFTDRTVSVSALCMQRNGPHPIAWEWDHKNLPTELPPHSGVTAVGGNGFGCAVLRGEHVRNGKFHCGPGNLCHDHNFYRSIVCEQGHLALLDWSCVCRHYVSPQEWKNPPPSSIPSPLTNVTALSLLPG